MKSERCNGTNASIVAYGLKYFIDLGSSGCQCRWEFKPSPAQMVEPVMASKKVSETIHIDRGKATRKLARQRVGQPPAQKIITPKIRRKPKYPEKDETDAVR